MADLLFEVGRDSNVRKPLTLRPGDNGHRGASGIVFELSSEPAKGLKDYFDHERLKFEPKVRTMIKVEYNRPHVDRFDLAWPEALVIDAPGNFRGFKMPFFGSGWVDLEDLIQASEAQQKYQLGERHRLMIAANLSMAVNHLHDLKIYCIDLKPKNVRVNLMNKSVGIIDCDGMSVVDISARNSHRFYADKCSGEFVAPENMEIRPHKFQDQEGHDGFALATIIFMLLNRGLHPYSGILSFIEPDAETVEGKIKNNLYPYGAGKGRIAPHKHSLYPFLPDETKALFDRAFTRPNSRPSADEWLSHLNRLALQSQSCENNPEYHIRYPQRECPICERDKSATAASQWTDLVGSSGRPASDPISIAPPPTPPSPPPSTGVSISQSGSHVNASPGSTTQPPVVGGGESDLISVLARIGIAGIVVVVLIGVFYLVAQNNLKSSPGTNSATLKTSSESRPRTPAPPIVKPPPPPSPIVKASPPPAPLSPAPAPPLKPSVEAVLQTAGLMGAWALDCNQRPSENNQHFRYFVEQGNEARMSLDMGLARHEFIIQSAEGIATNKIELKLEQLPQRLGQYVVLLMDGSRHRIWTSKFDNQEISAVDGIAVRSGQQTLWRMRCGSSPPPTARPVGLRCVAGGVAWNCDFGWRCGQMPGTCQMAR